MIEYKISLKDLTKQYKTKSKYVQVLVNVNLQVNAGEIVALHGPSGCGKSTTLLIAGGLLNPDSGITEICQTDLYKMSSGQRAGFRAEKIGFVFQQFHLIPYLNVIDNIRAPGFASKVNFNRSRAFGLAKQFGLQNRTDHLPSELSTGERQRTALARALFNDPEVILADEPTGNLDEDNAHLILDCLKDFSRSGGSVLLVTHDEKASSYADRILFMRNGSITHCATSTIN